MANNQIKILIVDDHSAVRAGIKNLLQAAQDMVVVGEGETGAEALELVATKKTDILLLDMELPDQRGDVVMQKVQEIKPAIKVLVVSSYSDQDYILTMRNNGASGYITKDEVPFMLLNAIRSIMQGKSWYSVWPIENLPGSTIEEQTLTIQEIHILEQLVLDRSMNEIAIALELTTEQLERYLNLLMKKFEAKSLGSLKHIAQRILKRRGL